MPYFIHHIENHKKWLKINIAQVEIDGIIYTLTVEV